MLHKTGAGAQALEVMAPFLKDQTAVGGKTTAYLCQNYACDLPVTDLESFKKLLGREGIGRRKI